MDARRFGKGILWGVAATVAMSLIMIVGMLTGMAPMPKPIPAAIVGRITGGALPQPALMAMGALLHLAYGGFWGGVLAAMTRWVTIGRGLALGLVLWLIMQVVVLPFLGWGFFGMPEMPRIAVATLVLHAIYGMSFGWLMDRGAEQVESPTSVGVA